MSYREKSDHYCNISCPHYDDLNLFCWLIGKDVKREDLCYLGITVDVESNELIYPKTEMNK